ncbi:MAG: hypothetical protein WBQ94_22020 [Terracidiphilus sp.]
MDLTPAQTLSSVFGDINNDVIVTANSQFWNSSGGQVAEFPYLAHATMPSYFGLGALISETSNDSVLTSDAVTNCVETILLNSSTSACTGAQTGGPASSSTGIAAASVFDESQATQQGSEKTSLEENPEERVQRLEHPFTLAPGRISVQAPQVHVPLGNPIDINVTLAPGKLVNGTLSISQHSKSGDQSQGSGPAKVVRQEGSTMTIEITPVQIGSVDVEIGAIYSDNAFVSQTIHLDVVPAATGVRNFSLNQGAHFMTLVLEDAEADRQKTLIPVVSYEGVKYPIYLDDSSGIKFSLKQDEVNPVIQIDEHGRVHALREGTAVLEGDFDGLRDVVQVTVYGKDDAPEGYRTVLH